MVMLLSTMVSMKTSNFLPSINNTPLPRVGTEYLYPSPIGYPYRHLADSSEIILRNRSDMAEIISWK